jgi:hypothetical protein
MFRPAGSLATTVKDLASFIAMWLSGKAPTVDGRPLLKPATISSAATSMFSSTKTPPASCKNGMKDSNGFSYSGCGTAFGFGVNWYVGTPPFIEHNGSIGVSGSNTRVDQTHKMGVTGLVSTEPYPTFNPQPVGLDPVFIDTVVYGMLNASLAADTGIDWSGRTLAEGVARVLYLSGKTPAQDDVHAFTSDFVAEHHLTSGNVVAFLNDWHDRVGKCRGFRVRDVFSATKIQSVFSCQNHDWDVVLTVSAQAPHRIAWAETSKPSPSPHPSKQACLDACTKDEGACMATAHGSEEKHACVVEKTSCAKLCK